MQPLRIGVICFSRARGGLELKLAELAALLAEAGHRVRVISPPESPLERETAGLTIPTFPLRPRFRYLDLCAAFRLGRLIRRDCLQILIIGRSQDVSTVRLAAGCAGRGSLVLLQQMQFDIPKKDLFHRWAYGGLHLWLTLTRSMRDSVIRNTTVPADRIRVLPLGVDLHRFRSGRGGQGPSREMFGLPPSGHLIAVVGRFDPQKGQEHLLRALPAILKSIPDVTLALMGEDTRGETGYGRYLRQLAMELGIDRSVAFLPFTHEVPRFLESVDVFVLPSLSETYGYVLLEALAMGVPAVGTNAGGVPEIIEDGVTGVLVPPANPTALAFAVVRLLSDPALRDAMGRQARRAAEERFDIRRQVGELRDLFETLPRENPSACD